jgi:hypothetical protein
VKTFFLGKDLNIPFPLFLFSIKSKRGFGDIMQEKTELVTLRLPRSLYAAVMAISKKGELYFSDVLKIAIKNGLSSKGANDEIAEKISLYREENEFYDADLKIRIRMKEAYALSNFKKLVNQLAINSDISRVKRMKVINDVLERINRTEGKDSDTHCEATKWLQTNYPQLIYKSKESRCIAREGKDIITE